MDLQLKGQRALITGGTRGIGRAIADTLADGGCNVSICARNQEQVDEAVAALSAKGVTAFGQAFDVGDGDALKGWVEASRDALGGIDILVSNVSGGNAPGEDGWRANFEYDVLGTFRVVEQGAKDDMFKPPHHPYTDLLLSSVPEMDPDWLDNLLAERGVDNIGDAAVGKMG